MRLLAATGDGVCLLEGDAAELRGRRALEGSGAQCVAADPVRPDTIWAGCRGHGVWRSRDAGRTWEDCGFPTDDVFAVAVSPADGTVYAGTEPSMLFASPDGGGWRELEALRRLPSAPTWSFPPRPWTSHVRWVAPSPHEPGLLLVAIELGGVMRSEDGGASWQDHRPGAKRDAHCLAFHPAAPGRAYEAAGDGAAWSSDGGDSWWPADAGRDRHYLWALALDPGDADTWFVSAAPGPYHAHGERSAQAYLYRWRGRGPWESLAGPLDRMPYALAVADSRLVAGMRTGEVLTSTDGGETWCEASIAGDPPPAIDALAAVPARESS